jgi:hypothetical protein
MLRIDLRWTERAAYGGFGHTFAVSHDDPTACDGVLT